METLDLKLEQKDRTLYWTNLSGEYDAAKAQAASDKIKDLVSTSAIDQLVVDNRRASGHWSSEFDHVWIDLMRFMPQHVRKTATLCPDVIIKLELNYLSAKAGTTDSVRAFTAEESEQLLAFLELSALDVDPPLPHKNSETDEKL